MASKPPDWTLQRATRLAEELKAAHPPAFVETYQDEVYLCLCVPLHDPLHMITVWWTGVAWQADLSNTDGSFQYHSGGWLRKWTSTSATPRS